MFVFCFSVDASRRTFQIVEVLQGSATTVQAPDSDVILHVPNGVHGILLGNIHTDLFKFAHLVKNTECIISPVCDLHVELMGEKRAERKPFLLKVPHIVENFEVAKRQIRVQIKETPKSKMAHALPLLENRNITLRQCASHVSNVHRQRKVSCKHCVYTTVS